jgi:hypothetical protein
MVLGPLENPTTQPIAPFSSLHMAFQYGQLARKWGSERSSRSQCAKNFIRGLRHSRCTIWRGDSHAEPFENPHPKSNRRSRVAAPITLTPSKNPSCPESARLLLSPALHILVFKLSSQKPSSRGEGGSSVILLPSLPTQIITI